MRCFLSPLALAFYNLSLLTLAGAHPHKPRTYEKYPQDWEVNDLFSGNQRFVEKVNAEYPGLMEQLGKTQNPPFMYIGCVDSR
jgi:hypothetical protein